MTAQQSTNENFTITSEKNIKVPFDYGAQRMLLRDVPNSFWLFSNTYLFLDMWDLAKFREIVEILQNVMKVMVECKIPFREQNHYRIDISYDVSCLQISR